jgi:hypothetical protein
MGAIVGAVDDVTRDDAAAVRALEIAFAPRPQEIAIDRKSVV